LVTIAIASTDSSCDLRAYALSQQLTLNYVDPNANQYDYLLMVTPTQLELHAINSCLKPLVVDFSSNAADYRRKHGGGNGQLIARAVNSKQKPRVIDATAGLGEDAFVLACLGCQVHMLERSPIIFALLADGLNRIKLREANLPLTLTNTNAIDYLSQLTAQQFPDVIYLDPMFPERSKTALVKKEMRILRDIVGKDADTTELLNIALSRTRKRVVVKRPRLASTISDKKPDIIFSGKSSRFDVYFKSN
jgi:16S rRNA (guanine1516-N2)-methyltransferase